MNLLLLFIQITFCVSVRERVSFNGDWLFSLNNATDAYSKNYSDSSWRKLNLPHDWSIESNFSNSYPAGSGGGALPGGTGWYRKKFTVPTSENGKKFYIDFDGVYRNSKVYLNGELLGSRPNGYISFRYDLTPNLVFGEENVLAVVANNSQQPNSRWYSGSGIYRNVWLVKTHEVHVDLWGTYVYTENVSSSNAVVHSSTTVHNNGNEQSVQVKTTIYDPSGRSVGTSTGNLVLGRNSTGTLNQTFTLSQPQLWSLDTPTLYRQVSEVVISDDVVDEYETKFGIRYFDWNVDTGFYLNGISVKVKGVCNHHDLGLLGAAINTRALERQVELLKGMGANGIRTSHNPPAPELLDICDRLGMLVLDEAFDMWKSSKTTYDYHLDFNEWHEKDLGDQVKRDRNHPSVFMWSIGNEVGEQVNSDASGTEKLTIELANIVKNLDKTRAITAGNNYATTSNHLFSSGALDVYGINYFVSTCVNFKSTFPGKKMISTESVSAFQTRGYYQMPSNTTSSSCSSSGNLCSSYDNMHASWGSGYEEVWREVVSHPHYSGLFIWTGFDYLGEPTPYGWPSRSSYFGIIDLAGMPKDIYYMFQAEWTNKTVLHMFPHWNWNTSQDIDIWVYYNNADEVELFVNGVSQGSKSKASNTFHVMWRVKFAQGSIRAVSRKSGVEVASQETFTAGDPAKVVLIPDRTTLKADGTDLSYVTIEIRDEDDNLCPNATNLVTFSVEGVGFIAGTDNGNPNSAISLKTPERNAYYGKAMVAVQNNGTTGKITLTAKSNSLPNAVVEIQVQ
jgi:beta-galactosidase